jgi:hypothetical protein
LVLSPIPFEVENAIAKLTNYKSPSCDKIPTGLLQAVEILRSEGHQIFNSVCNKEE